MKILVDSNILLRLVKAGDPQRQLARDAVDKLLGNNNELCAVPQSYYEFWVAATRPMNVNGLGFTAAQAETELVRFKGFYRLLGEDCRFFGEWEALVIRHAIIGKPAHDARLAAAMIVHGITHLLTFNKQDFQRFTNISAWTPANVMAMP